MEERPRIAVDAAQLDELRMWLDAARAEVRAMGASLPPQRGLEIVLRMTDNVDHVLRALVELTEASFASSWGPEAQELVRSVEIVALGGYGRRELCPWSDVDLLFLLPDEACIEEEVVAPVRRFVESVLYALWDLGIELGHAVRTVEQTLAVAEQDTSVATSLLDARLITRKGHADTFSPRFDALHERLELQLWRGSSSTVSRFIEAKLAEARARRARFGASVFLLEPNVKESEGALRDLHTALWVSRARWRTRGVRDLMRAGVLSGREGTTIERAYGFLTRVRSELHFQAGRRQDHLRFEYQEQIAPRLGYVDPTETDHDRKTHGVERFMRAYYFHASQMHHHAGLIVERATSHSKRRACVATPAPGGFKLWNGKLTVNERSQFEKDPGALIRIFRIAQEENLEVYSYTKDLITEHAHRIGRVERRQKDVVRDFIAMLEEPKSDGSCFANMHALGLLRRVIPELARVTARWQHSLYHVYTVDAHSLVVLANLKRLRRGDFGETERAMTRLSAGLPRPAVVNLAALLHDVGKGWPRGDHSVRGEKVAFTVGARLEAAGLEGWTSEDTKDLAWLVRQHLTMSDISQRRDLSDPELIESFAGEVKTQERLTMLYLLTFADMKGTSPKVWTDWKRGLLRELFRATSEVLAVRSRGGQQVELHFESRRRRAERELLLEATLSRELRLDPLVVRTFCQIVPARYMLSFSARRMARHVQMWRDVSRRGGIAIHVRHHRRDRATKLTVVCPDKPGLLALIAGTLAAHRLQILSAQVFSTEPLPVSAQESIDLPPAGEAEAYAHMRSNGAPSAPSRTALDVLFVTDEHGALCDDAERWANVRNDLGAVLRGDVTVVDLMRRLLGSKFDGPHRPAVKTRVAVADNDSTTETVLDVFCEDRLGTLYLIAKTLSEQRVSISLAKISTQGHRVADGFYLTDADSGAKLESQQRLRSLVRAVEEALTNEIEQP